jgi:hypothetical protein
MTEPWLWEEADILSLISNVLQESLTLDYKRCDSLQMTDSKKKEISKDVSAFANSAGGVIVYGVEEDKHIPTRIDVGFDPLAISKEWLEQVINSTIERRIEGVRIKEVTLSGPKAGKVIYVVSIPQSRRAPHMAADNRYYKRFNFESVPMEDYEVRDVSRRLETPDLYISFRTDHAAALVTDPGNEERYAPVCVEVIVGNRSSAAAIFALMRYCVDSRLQPTRGQKTDNSVQVAGTRVELFSSVVEWRGGNRLPLWETILFKLGHFEMIIPKLGGPFYLFWDVQSPMMERNAGVVTVEVAADGMSFKETGSNWKYEKEVMHQV